MFTYSPSASGRHTIEITLMSGKYSGMLFMETGGPERGRSIITSAFDFLDYPEIIIDNDCYLDYDHQSRTFSVSLYKDGLNGNIHELNLKNLSRQELADMIVGVRISEYVPE